MEVQVQAPGATPAITATLHWAAAYKSLTEL